MGIQNLANTLGQAIAPAVTSAIVASTGSYFLTFPVAIALIFGRRHLHYDGEEGQVSSAALAQVLRARRLLRVSGVPTCPPLVIPDVQRRKEPIHADC